MLFNKLKEKAGRIADAVKESAKDVSEKAREIIPDEVRQRTIDIADSLKESAKDVSEKARGIIPDQLLQKANTLAETITDSAKAASDKVGEFLDSQLDTIESYCSWCFEKHTCTPKEKNNLKRNIYTCDGCGNEIVKCRVCSNKAKSGEDWSWASQFCAVHEGSIAKFETLNLKLSTIGEYRDVFEREEPNYKKIGTTAAYTVGGAIVIAPLAFAAAPAIGGAIGSSMLGLSGAAATNAGLATLGGGALAAGGAGMAGGAAVVTAVGSSLGGKLGAVISNSYFGDIEGFEIKKIKDGIEPTIICIDGFLTQKDEKSDSWLKPISTVYPDNAIFVVEWEAKRLLDIGRTFGFEAGKKVCLRTIKGFALSASKKAAIKVAPLGAAYSALNIATNPWSIARIKALQTGALLADIIARTECSYILIGHSLGARVIYSCLSALKTKKSKYIQHVHLLGGAVNNFSSDSEDGKINWHSIHQAVSGVIFNYYSENDDVLKYLYSLGEFFQGNPIGRNTINAPEVFNVDVSHIIAGHSVYKNNIHHFIKV